MSRFSSLPARHRFSLAWRVTALSSLLLLTLVALLIWLGHHHLTQQFANSRVAHHERQQREIRLALQRSADNLRQLAGLTASAAPLGEALAIGDINAIDDALRDQWPPLQLEAGVDEVFVFDPLGRLLGHSGGNHPPLDIPVEGWVDEVLSSEAPMTTLRCGLTCQQFAAVPILLAGSSIGMVVLSRSLADVTREAREVSGSEVALLVAGYTGTNRLEASRQLPEWNGHLVALTSRETTLPLLERASRSAPIAELAKRPLNLSYAQRDLELSAVYMENDADWRSTGYFLLISDVTAQVVAIQKATNTLLLLGGAGWLAAQLLLLAILLGPMARLRRVAALLPALARRDFTEVRGKLPERTPRLSNEIDVVERATRTLANQLANLEASVTENSRQLAERIDELAHERDFVNSLLDTAQVFIVVHSQEGRIRRVNDYTRARLALKDSELIGRYFSDIFDQARHTALPGRFMAKDASFDSASSTPRQEEKTLQTADKRCCIVAWYHSVLPASPREEALCISVGLDITERKAAEERLIWLAERDPLTELFNRRYFQDALQNALLHNGEGAILLLDLDQFKEINELSGHHVGDHLLREVAETLFLNLGQRSIIARLGGDEFALLLEGVSSEQAISMAGYIHQLLSGIGFQSAGRKHHISASMGIALFPLHGRNPADLLASADMAMYKAKESTHQRWYLLSQAENAKDELQDRVYWVEQLHHALENDSFELMVQPIVRLADQDIKHYEVLLRLRHPDGNLIAPQHFIAIAEQSGLVVPLDRWVIQHSVQALGTLQDRGISLAVNLSGQSLHDLELKQYLTDELQRSGADPHHLILEVTETAAITDFSTARNVLQTVRDLGCRTALDDFGIGFSSFHYLGQLPVDYIKIDGSFIRSLLINPDSHTIVKAIADIAKGFGKQTIAEFVDQAPLLPILQGYGITYGQGFHVGKPLPLAQLLRG
ncbi:MULTISPECIES: EAL domain-containing protein [unclassified Halomonas]|uniref:bifunctional diguanylate cyclase/phosphodiesterase n=1 Tax=unclassified Halomonas TaxID=2609666 RepID=UPI001EF72140|nr:MULTISPECIES: EAL domain-containing protein [unclassified Halomonas]MCG7577783.1 EAL domain-containing protein [Halomonas sp. MMH1-48]MCG7604829.1 EAL domain-containing protein [Halomonas sp. MM17-34]MCG7614046.1 EAL domain-containing protein [Halomonas sp. MM17-29]MCG7620948.1 EAL domain-containing protein [Halomonas sp. DSH1-27]